MFPAMIIRGRRVAVARYPRISSSPAGSELVSPPMTMASTSAFSKLARKTLSSSFVSGSRSLMPASRPSRGSFERLGVSRRTFTVPPVWVKLQPSWVRVSAGLKWVKGPLQSNW